MKKYAILFLALMPLLLSAPGHATVITYVSGPGSLDSSDTTKTGTLADPWLLGETYSGVSPFILKFSDSNGEPLGPGNPTGTGHDYGKWIKKTVVNNSGVEWTSFEIEVQSTLGIPSGQGDGISFADGSGITGSFSSDQFSTYTRIDDNRDYLNFHGGVVGIGESVTFWFAITDNAPNNPFWLAETANKTDVPEPATLLLLGFGIFGAAIMKKKV